jgi:hypothetical protein
VGEPEVVGTSAVLQDHRGAVAVAGGPAAVLLDEELQDAFPALSVAAPRALGQHATRAIVLVGPEQPGQLHVVGNGPVRRERGQALDDPPGVELPVGPIRSRVGHDAPCSCRGRAPVRVGRLSVKQRTGANQSVDLNSAGPPPPTARSPR